MCITLVTKLKPSDTNEYIAKTTVSTSDGSLFPLKNIIYSDIHSK